VTRTGELARRIDKIEHVDSSRFLWRRYLRGVDETHYSVRGMHIAKATAALSKLPGYVSAEFNLKSGSAVVMGGVDP